jgi:hypothetical protein
MKGATWLPTAIIGLSVSLAACGDDDEVDTGEEASPATSEASTETSESTGDAEGETFASSALPVPVSVSISPGAGFVVPEGADVSDIFVVYQEDFPNGYIDSLQPTLASTQVLALCGTEEAPNFAEFRERCQEIVSTAEIGE